VIANDVDARMGTKVYVTLSDFLADLKVLFALREHSFTLELKGLKQGNTQSCKDFFSKVRQVCIKHWVPPPADIQSLHTMVSNLSEKHRVFVESQFTHVMNTLDVSDTNTMSKLTFESLERWGAQSDMNFMATRGNHLSHQRPQLAHAKAAAS
jgi:hypothetical protein